VQSMSPEAVGEDKAQCESLMAELESSHTIASTEFNNMLAWVVSSALALSLTKYGCRLVQKAIDLADAVLRARIARNILPHASDIYTSPNANHVLGKLVEIMPQSQLGPLWEALRGQTAAVARHRFGSRILQRSVEHCSEVDSGFLLDEVQSELEALARHPFGNFVVQTLLEHGSEARRRACVERLLPHVLEHATHKTASNVVQCLLEHSDVESQAAIADAFLAGHGVLSLEAIASTRYGSFVVQRLVDRLHPRIVSVKARIKAAKPQLQESGFSRRKIVDFLGDAFFHN